EVEAAVLDQLVELLEAPLVEQPLDSLARRELALAVLPLAALVSPAGLGAARALAQVVERTAQSRARSAVRTPPCRRPRRRTPALRRRRALRRSLRSRPRRRPTAACRPPRSRRRDSSPPRRSGAPASRSGCRSRCRRTRRSAPSAPRPWRPSSPWPSPSPR